MTPFEIPLHGTVAELTAWLQQFDPRAPFTLSASVGVPEFSVDGEHTSSAAAVPHGHIRAAIEQVAPRHGLEPDLVEAVVLTESAGNPAAWNPEPRYRYLVDARSGRPFRPLTVSELASEVPPSDFRALAGDPDQEWWGQQASWGLMQVMGAVAREHGYRQPYRPELCRDVVQNLQIGCRHLAGHLQWAKGDVDKALRAYNGGRGSVNEPRTAIYVTKVRQNLALITGGRR